MLIATPNLCLDRTEWLPALVPGGVLRARSTEVTAGGKGVNVARVLRAFGHQPPIVGLVGERDGAQLRELLAEEGASLVPVPAPGRVRQSVIMLEERTGRATVLNEPGTAIATPVWARYRAAVRERLTRRRLLVCSGSLPPGAPLDGYGQLVELARAAGALSIVDTAPRPLAATLAYHPDLVTPNLEEAEAALAGDAGAVLHGGGTSTGRDVPDRAVRAARALCARGAWRAAVTAGERGVAYAERTTATSPATAHWLPAVRVTVVSAVGAGDAFVGGLAVALLDLPGVSASQPPSTEQWWDALAYATATAAASCERVRAGGVDPERVAELLELVEDEPEPAR